MMFMTRRLHPLAAGALLALSLMGASARADSIIYKCVDAEGRIEFTDTAKRNCKVLDLPSSIAAPPRARSAPARATAAAAATAPADFPKVSSYQQKTRDDERRDILNDELRKEEQKLADLRREFNGGEPERQGNERNYAKYQERVIRMREDIARGENNVDTLKREIANIK